MNPDDHQLTELLGILLMLSNPLLPRGYQRHEFHELVVPVRGTYSCLLERSPLNVESGSVVYHPPGTRHRPTFALDGSVSFLLLQWRGPGLRVAAGRHPDAGGHLRDALQWLWSTWRRAGDTTALQGCLLEAIGHQLAASETEEECPHADPVRRVIDYLHLNFRRAVTIAQLCQLAGMSRTSLLRSFARRTGTTPHRLQTSIRMSKATHHLVQFQGDIAAAGRAVGYQSDSTFRRAFLLHHGLPPGRWYREAIGSVETVDSRSSVSLQGTDNG